MDEQILEKFSLPLPATKITPVKPANSEFTLCKCRIQGVGRNRNYSYMSKENIEKALPTLSYVPVVGHLMPKYDEDGEQIGYYFGGHDAVIDDGLNLHWLTVPFGVVVADSFGFEDVEEYGKTVEYLTGMVYLWTGRYPELKKAIYDDETWFGQSMEISKIVHRPWESDSNFREFVSWNYSALCILGKSDDEEYHTEPCYMNADISPVTFNLGSAQFDQLMGEMREQLALCFDKSSCQKGGKVLTQEVINEIFAKFELTQEDASFEITEDMTAEQLTAALEEFVASKTTAEPEVKPEAEPTDTSGDGAEFSAEGEVTETQVVESALFSVTYREKEEKLRELCGSLNNVVRDDDGNVVSELYCYLVDFDDSVVYVRVNSYKPDKYDSKTCRYAYAMSETGDAQFSGEPEEVFQKWLTAAEIAKLDEDKNQMATLLKFKQDTERAAYEAKVDEIADKFADVSGLEEFAAIKEQALAADNGIEMMETQLFALRGKQVKFEKPVAQAVVRVGIDQDEKSDDDDGYGGLVYRARRRNRR